MFRLTFTRRMCNYFYTGWSCNFCGHYLTGNRRASLILLQLYRKNQSPRYCFIRQSQERRMQFRWNAVETNRSQKFVDGWTFSTRRKISFTHRSFSGIEIEISRNLILFFNRCTINAWHANKVVLMVQNVSSVAVLSMPKFKYMKRKIEWEKKD